MPSVRLALLAGALVGGEATGFALRILVDAWAWISFAALLAFLVLHGWGRRRLLGVVVFTLGVCLALRTDAVLKEVLDANAGLLGPPQPVDLTVEGTVTRRPCAKTGAWIVDFPSRIGPVSLKVLMHVARYGRVPKTGETWRAAGWISRREDKDNRFARRTLWIPTARRARCVREAVPDTRREGWRALGSELSRRLGEGLSWCPELVGLNRAILLGRRNDLPRERKRAFLDAGTMHVFAISGLHVMVVAWFLNAALGILGLSSRARGLVAMPLVWGYVVLTGARPSAIRAAMMASLMLMACAVGRRPDSLSAWSATVLIVYGLAPERMFDLGCALSFTVMFGIVLWCHWSGHFQPWFPEGSRRQRFLGFMGVSCAAWVAGVPLAAHAFGRFTPGGLLANVAVIWCAQWMVRIGAGALAASFVCLPLGALLNMGAAALTWGMVFVSERVASLPFSNYDITPWSFSTCALWYAGWFGVLLAAERFLPRRGKVSRRWWK